MRFKSLSGERILIKSVFFGKKDGATESVLRKNKAGNGVLVIK